MSSGMTCLKPWHYDSAKCFKHRGLSICGMNIEFDTLSLVAAMPKARMGLLHTQESWLV